MRTKNINTILFFISFLFMLAVVPGIRANAYNASAIGSYGLLWTDDNGIYHDSRTGTFYETETTPSGESDDHWYSFWQTNRSYNKIIHLKNVDVTSSISLEIVDSDGAVVKTIGCSKGKTITYYLNVNGDDAFWYLHVKKTGNRAEGTYVISAEETEDISNTKENASQYYLTTDITTNLMGENINDEDWYYFDLLEDATCEIYLKNIDVGGTVTAIVYDSDVAELRKIYANKAKEKKDSLTLKAGTYYLKVSTNTKSSKYGNYKFNISYNPVTANGDAVDNYGGSYDAGSTNADAMTLTIGSDNYETLAKGDTDYFYIDTTGNNAYYTFYLKNINAGYLHMDIEEADTYRLQRVNASKGKTVEGDALNLKKNTRYFIKITGEYPSTTGDYALSYTVRNDTTTKKIKLKKTYSDYLDAKDDTDTFKIKIKKGGKHKITLKNIDATAKIEVFRGNKRIYTGGKTAHNTLNKVLDLKKGTYKIKVSHYSIYKGVGSYKLKICKK